MSRQINPNALRDIATLLLVLSLIGALIYVLINN